MADKEQLDFGLTRVHRAALESDDNFMKIIKKTPELATDSHAILGNSPLFCAVSKNHTKTLRWYYETLPETFETVNSLGYSPLQWAIDTGAARNEQAILYLIEQSGDLSHQDNLGNHVLHTLIHGLAWQEEDVVVNLITMIVNRDPTLLSQANLEGLIPAELASRKGLLSDAVAISLKCPPQPKQS